MEIKTCEEYVITRVLELDSEVIELKQQIAEMKDKVEQYEANLEFIKDSLNIRFFLDSDGDRTISSSGFYESKYSKTNTPKIDRMIELFNLKLDEEEE